MTYTNDELVERIWDKETIAMLLNRHSYLISNHMGREALNTLWVTGRAYRETASLAVNRGYYVGIDEIARHLVADDDALLRENLRPYAQAGLDVRETGEFLGLGMAGMDTVTTPLVYVSDDGRTARYLGYRLGFRATGKPDGDADCYLDFGLVFADLVKEDGEWKLWHLVLEHDHTVTVGENYEDLPVLREGYQDPLERYAGRPTVEATVYDPLFGWEYIWRDMPRPHYTYLDKEGYGPGGDLGKPYYLRERR